MEEDVNYKMTMKMKTESGERCEARREAVEEGKG